MMGLAGQQGTALAEPGQAAETIAQGLAEFLGEHTKAAVLEDGKMLFDMRTAKYRLTAEHGRCTLHLWDDDRNMVRRVSAVAERKGVLKLSTHRFGQTKPQTLELVGDRDRRTPSTREATRVKYVRVLERALAKTFPEWTPDGMRTAMDLEKSFGPAYARGVQVRGTQAWAVIGVNGEETQGTVDGVLTVGILWLEQCRENAGGRRLFQGLRLVVPKGMAALTLSRMMWLSETAAKWELWELEEADEAMTPREPVDQGNLTTRLLPAANEEAAKERFAGGGGAGDGGAAGGHARAGGAAAAGRSGDGVSVPWAGVCAGPGGVCGESRSTARWR